MAWSTFWYNRSLRLFRNYESTPVNQPGVGVHRKRRDPNHEWMQKPIRPWWWRLEVAFDNNQMMVHPSPWWSTTRTNTVVENAKHAGGPSVIYALRVQSGGKTVSGMHANVLRLAAAASVHDEKRMDGMAHCWNWWRPLGFSIKWGVKTHSGHRGKNVCFDWAGMLGAIWMRCLFDTLLPVRSDYETLKGSK